MKENAKVKGIGVLELMLVLALISLIVITSVRYYQAANNSNKIASGVDMISSVKAAVKNYHNDYGGTAPSLPTIQQLVNASYLPSSFNTGVGVNPWGGNIGVQAAQSSGSSSSGAGDCDPTTAGVIGSTYAICLSGFPATICPQLTAKIESIINTVSGETVTGCQNSGQENTTDSLSVVLQY